MSSSTLLVDDLAASTHREYMSRMGLDVDIETWKEEQRREHERELKHATAARRSSWSSETSSVMALTGPKAVLTRGAFARRHDRPFTATRHLPVTHTSPSPRTHTPTPPSRPSTAHTASLHLVPPSPFLQAPTDTKSGKGAKLASRGVRMSNYQELQRVAHDKRGYVMGNAGIELRRESLGMPEWMLRTRKVPEVGRGREKRVVGTGERRRRAVRRLGVPYGSGVVMIEKEGKEEGEFRHSSTLSSTMHASSAPTLAPLGESMGLQRWREERGGGKEMLEKEELLIRAGMRKGEADVGRVEEAVGYKVVPGMMTRSKVVFQPTRKEAETDAKLRATARRRAKARRARIGAASTTTSSTHASSHTSSRFLKRDYSSDKASEARKRRQRALPPVAFANFLHPRFASEAIRHAARSGGRGW